MVRLAKTAMKMLCLSSLLFTSNLFAATCFEKSPNFINLGEEYYDFEEPLKLSNAEQNQIEAIFRQVHDERKWRGQGTHIECFGTDNAPEEQVNNLKLRVKTESNENLHIAFNAEIKNLDNGITRNERLDILGNTPIFSFESKGSNHFTFTEKYRSASGAVKQNSKRFTRLVENLYEIKLNGSQFQFIKNYYINGVFVARDEWYLSPSR
jgi:hypothetical protein